MGRAGPITAFCYKTFETLGLLCYFVWGYFKDIVDREPPNLTLELETESTKAVEGSNENTLEFYKALKIV